MTSSPPSERPRGRRPRTGDNDSPETRAALLQAGRAAFLSEGYSGATLRGIARDAGVDPALIAYFFGSKRGLFSAAMEMTIDPAQSLAAILAEGSHDLARRILQRVLTTWDDPSSGNPLLTLVRAAAAEEEAAAMLRGYVRGELLTPIAEHLSGAAPVERAALIGAQLLGLIQSRYVLRLEPIASMATAEVIELFAPYLERLIADPELAPGPALL